MIWIVNEGNFVVKIDKDQALYHRVFFGEIESCYMDLLCKTILYIFLENIIPKRPL